MKKLHCLDIFISSPSDVREERELVEKSIARWNADYSNEKRVLLNPIKWESDLPISSISTPQPLINQELLSSSDILIAIFWTKAGTPTESYISGTVEEIERFLEAEKPVMLYFLTKNVDPTQIDPVEISKINDLKKRYKLMLTYGIIKNEKELQDTLQKDLNFNVIALMKGKFGKSKKVVATDLHGSRKAWWQISISKQISDYLEKNNVSYVYKREITFQENCDIMISQTPTRTGEALREIIKRAREHAFGLKYGEFDYKDDLRVLFKRDWFRPIWDILAEMPKVSKRVIGVGSNNGDELAEIFGNNPNYEIEVLDLSKQAIDKGRNFHKNFKFHVGDMESCALKHQDYDVYLNLRAIHSSGVELKSALIECYRILKPGGFAIFSISNGYFVKPDSGEKIILGGMYDTRIQDYSSDKPYHLAEKIRKKLGDYEFENIGVRTFSTEIFVWGQKSSGSAKI